jgi:hypothetical protein
MHGSRALARNSAATPALVHAWATSTGHTAIGAEPCMHATHLVAPHAGTTATAHHLTKATP